MNEKMEIKIIFGIEIIFMRFCFYLKYNKFIRHKNLLIILFFARTVLKYVIATDAIIIK